MGIFWSWNLYFSHFSRNGKKPLYVLTFYYTYFDEILVRWQFQTVSTRAASATTASNMRTKWIYNLSVPSA